MLGLEMDFWKRSGRISELEYLQNREPWTEVIAENILILIF